MKLASSLFGIVLIWSLSISTCLTSCTKDKTIFDTVTITRNDTLFIKDSAFTPELLTAYPWKVNELRAVYGGDSIYYLRGGLKNTTGFGDRSIEAYTFNVNGSGSLLDGNLYTHNISNWQFANPEKTKLTFFLSTNSPSGSYLITWENIRYKNGIIYTDEYYYDVLALKYYHGQAIRFQVK